MKFLVDANLPPKLARFLRDRGHEATHTKDLPLGNEASDTILTRFSHDEVWIVITKDRGFVDAVAAGGGPYKLLHITLGNLTNAALLELFDRNLGTIIELLERNSFVEVAADGIAVRG